MLNGFFKVLNWKLKVFYMQVLFIDSKFIASILEETTWPCQRTRSHSSPNEWNDSSSPFAETIFRNFCYSSHGCSKPSKSSNVSRLPFFPHSFTVFKNHYRLIFRNEQFVSGNSVHNFVPKKRKFNHRKIRFFSVRLEERNWIPSFSWLLFAAWRQNRASISQPDFWRCQKMENLVNRVVMTL